MFVLVIGPCLVCKIPFSFHPNKVPSCNGQPICEGCAISINNRRKELDLAPWVIQDGAYQGVDEDEVNWSGKPIPARTQEN